MDRHNLPVTVTWWIYNPNLQFRLNGMQIRSKTWWGQLWSKFMYCRGAMQCVQETRRLGNTWGPTIRLQKATWIDMVAKKRVQTPRRNVWVPIWVKVP